MQVQIKKQTKIELDQQDIVDAVALYLESHNIAIKASELQEINFVKSPKDGLRATLNITEDSGDMAEESVPQYPDTKPVGVVNGTVTEQGVAEAVDRMLAEEPEPQEESEPEPEPEDEVQPVEEPEPVATVAEAPRTSIFPR